MTDVDPGTEETVEPSGTRSVYPANVPIYPWNDPTNGTPLVEHEGEPTPTGEEAIAALQRESEEMTQRSGYWKSDEEERAQLERGSDVA